MEQTNDYNSRDQKRARFLHNSKPEMFYVECFNGGLLFPNHVLAHRFDGVCDSYYEIKRDAVNAERFTGRHIRVSQTGDFFSVANLSGYIWDWWHDIEANCTGPKVQYLDPEKFNQNANDQIRRIFSN